MKTEFDRTAMTAGRTALAPEQKEAASAPAPCPTGAEQGKIGEGGEQPVCEGRRERRPLWAALLGVGTGLPDENADLIADMPSSMSSAEEIEQAKADNTIIGANDRMWQEAMAAAGGSPVQEVLPVASRAAADAIRQVGGKRCLCVGAETTEGQGRYCSCMKRYRI